MTGKQAYIAEYARLNVDPVAFGGSKGLIKASREYSNARYTDQTTCEFAKRKNKTLIESLGLQKANQNAGTEDIIDAGDSEKEDEYAQDCFLKLSWEKEFAQETKNLLIQAGATKASKIPPLEDIYQNPTDGIFTNSSYDDEGAVQNFTNLETIVSSSESLILVDLIIGRMLFWKTEMGYRNKKDERGVVVRNKARLVAQGHRQEEGIDYDEVFAPVARIEAIRIFLAFASYMGFIVYQMDVKSAFLYGKIDEESSLSILDTSQTERNVSSHHQDKYVGKNPEEVDFCEMHDIILQSVLDLVQSHPKSSHLSAVKRIFSSAIFEPMPLHAATCSIT
ncbi:putative ribonuclease H-like domain-containing protein [Tanacetum coccineum]